MSHNIVLGINDHNVPFYLGYSDTQENHYQVFIATGWLQMDYITFRKSITTSPNIIFVIGLNRFQRLIQYIDISPQNNQTYQKIIYQNSLQQLIEEQNITLQCQPHMKAILETHQLKIEKFRLQNFDCENNVPILFTLLLNRLENVTDEGLFRKSPDMEQFEIFWQSLLIGQYELINQVQDIHMISQGVKRFLICLQKEGSLLDDPQYTDLLFSLKRILQQLMTQNKELTALSLAILLNPCLRNLISNQRSDQPLSKNIQAMNQHLARVQQYISQEDLF